MQIEFPSISKLTQKGSSRVTSRDRALAKHLHDVFEFDLERANVDGIHFYTQDGIVTLHGTVPHDLDEELLIDLVKGVSGVEGVVSNLTITDKR